jgi:hypothetical protein
VATPRRPYVKLPIGLFDDALKKGASRSAAFLLAQVVTHRSKRSIPGVLAYGPAGLAESLTGATVPATTRELKELVKVGLVLADFKVRPPVMYVVGSVEADPPASLPAIKGMAQQLRHMPQCAVTAAVQRAIEASLSGSEWLSKWRELLADGPSNEQSDGPSNERNEGLSLDQLDGPLRIPYSDSDSDSEDPTTTAAYQRAWARLPRPPFAAAAADLLRFAAREIKEKTFNALISELASSKWVSGVLQKPPTLNRLLRFLDGDGLLQRVVDGEFREPALKWSCPECETQHEPLEDCPPPCRGCGRIHDERIYCVRLRELLISEREALEQSQRAGTA